MATSLVLILLLDNIPGNINRSLENTKPFGQHLSEAHACALNNIVDPILHVVNKKLDIKIIPKWRPNEKHLNIYYVNKTKDIFKETSIETLFNIQAVLDNSAEADNSNSFERTKSLYETPIKSFVSSEDKSQCAEANKIESKLELNRNFIPIINPITFMDTTTVQNPVKTQNNTTKPSETIKDEGVAIIRNTERKRKPLKEIKEFPKKVPFLVAIFESLLNVTAQTCGGAVLSPHWVITSASCVNVLGDLVNVSHTEKSQYTIIANSSNPILEGTIHTVTQVLQHPDPESPIPSSLFGLVHHLHNTLEDSKRVNTKETQPKTPTLALMKVDPEIQVEPVEIDEQDIANSTEVWLYGWEMNNFQNDTSNTNSTMVSSSFPAKTMSAYECELQYGVTDRSTLCLAANNTVTNNHISSGSPVLSLRNGRLSLVAVAHSEDHAPLLAQPVTQHKAWIKRTVNYTVLI